MKYTEPKMELIALEVEDIVTASTPAGEEGELDRD